MPEAFEAHRSHLFGVAYRMLGTRADAEDAVQEAWLRYAAAGPDAADLRAWLTTVVARICLDVLRSARVRRAAYVGPWLPEPLVSRLPAADDDPAETAVRAEQVSLALLVVLERLSPEQRVAFVLHDVFGVPFADIAAVLAVSPANARQLASRGRRAVDAAPAARVSAGADLAEQHRVLAAFLAAAHDGDLAGLVRVLAPDVEFIGDGGGLAPSARRPLVGAQEVARFVAGVFRQARRRDPRGEPVLVNGRLGLVVEAGGLLVVVAPVVADGAIVALYHQLNPEKLRAVPRPEPAAAWPPIPPRPAPGR
ncbi:RNA polymerase sigma factor SigJ [Polymorphospora rubra]|uniref:RNA polymerase sigma factor SigJ n=1 Tax=Polymorphospora rubra TaxID=338584 RepID=A0A810N4W6_9ACTN|nr:RNA polymerase sigma factor SigJ [Polymorphospora rubra]BCJ67229.1 RNA polymerase sigma factor SigJ [Polymorphospora rubra]